jgi:hypothetical protein
MTIPLCTWTRVAGDPAAQHLLQQYPDPRALRAAVEAQGWLWLLKACGHLPFDGTHTIGDVGDWRRQDIALLHARITEAAKDADVWRAPDGTLTRCAR